MGLINFLALLEGSKETVPIKRHCPAHSPHTCCGGVGGGVWGGANPTKDRSWEQEGLSFPEFSGGLCKSRMDDGHHLHQQNKTTNNPTTHKGWEALSFPCCQVAGGKGLSGGREPEAPFLQGHGPSKTKKNKTRKKRKKKPLTPQKVNDWNPRGGAGRMVGSEASLVAECMPCKACGGAQSLPTPQAGGSAGLLADFFLLVGAFFPHSRHHRES